MLLSVPLAKRRAVGKNHSSFELSVCRPLTYKAYPQTGRCHLAHTSDADSKRANRAELVAIQAEPASEVDQITPTYHRVPIPSKTFWPIAP